MQLKLKSSKCRSFSFSSGKPTAITFNLVGNAIETIEQDPHKFQGSQITFYGKPEEAYNYILTHIEDKLRGEYKAKMSCRFMLTVHAISSTN